MGFLGTLLGRSASYDIPPVVLDWALKTALWAVFTKEIWGLSAGQQIVEIVSNSKTPLPPMFASLEYWTGLLLQLGAKKEIGMEDVMMSEFIPSLPAGSPPKETATRVTDAQLDTIALAIRIWILALARNTEMDSSVRLSCFKVFVKLSMDGLLHERHFIGCASALARLFQDMPPTEWNRMVHFTLIMLQIQSLHTNQ